MGERGSRPTSRLGDFSSFCLHRDNFGRKGGDATRVLMAASHPSMSPWIGYTAFLKPLLLFDELQTLVQGRTARWLSIEATLDFITPGAGHRLRLFPIPER